MRWVRVGAGVWLALACARLPEPSFVPLMGMGERGAAADSLAVGPGDRAPANAVTVPGDSSAALAQSLLLLPFRNTSEYSGPWRLSVAVPATLAAAIAGSSSLRPLLLDSTRAGLNRREWEGSITLERGLALARGAGADYAVFGEIEALSMKRFRATVPVGGYRSYEGLTRITLRPVRVIDQEPAGTITRDGLEDTKQYGITNPAAYVPFEKEYFLLNQMAWGSPEFGETLVGKSVNKCVASLAAALDSLIAPPPQLRALEPAIVDLEGARAYINVGLADGVRTGDKFGVWDHGRVLTDPNTGLVLGRTLPRRVGVVQVEQVLSEHLSVVRILDGVDQVRPEYSVRAE